MTEFHDTSNQPLKFFDTSRVLDRIDPDCLVNALGAEKFIHQRLQGNPFSTHSIRIGLFQKRDEQIGAKPLEHSSTQSENKLPISEPDWHSLEEIAHEVSANGSTVTATQIASILLKISIRLVKSPESTVFQSRSQ